MNSWRDNLRKVEPYVPGEQPELSDMIKLNTNENPYPPSPEVRRVIQNFDDSMLRLYPDPNSTELAKAVAECYDVKSGQVFVGVGSDDVLAIAFMTFFNSEKPILFPDITYSFYDVWAELFQIPYEKVPLNDVFEVEGKDYYGENGGVVIANPNAPTGIAQGLPALEEIIKHNQDVVVIIDEAYIDFGGTSALELTEKYDNVLIVQTLSKSRSLAGMRIGYAIGQEELIRAMNDVRFSFNSYPMTRLSVSIGAAAIRDRAYFEETCRKIIETREWTKKELAKLGFHFWDSCTNFIFARHKTIPGIVFFEALRKQKIFVRRFGNQKRIEDYLRISIGTQEEMERFIKEVKHIMEQAGSQG